MPFIVEIRYREKSRETWVETARLPYKWRFRSETTDEQTAVANAVAEFRRIQAMSSVGWSRDIVSVQVVRTEVT